MKYHKESFLEKAKEVHHNKYDYSKMQYVNQSTKIEIICPEHGSYFRTPSYHVQGGGCPVCARQRYLEGCRKPMSEEAKAKRAATNLAKYGATTFAASKEAKRRSAEGTCNLWSKASYEKGAETNLERYGAKTWAESDTGRQALKDMCESEDARKAMSERAKSEAARQHYQETSMKNWNAPHWTQSDIGREYLHEIFSTDEERLARSRRMLSPEVRAKIEANGIKKYGVPYYWQSEEGRKRLKVLLNSEDVVERTKQTNLERYGHETWQGSETGRMVMASKEVREKTKATNMERYGAATWSETEEGRIAMGSEELQSRMIATKRANGTINDSQPERDAYVLLVSKFGEEDVVPQYYSDRYPFKCDFYVKSRDLFIELNAYWMHGGHWFDGDSEEDLEKLQSWIANDKPSYERAVYVWAQNDPEKRATAIKNNLNYLVFWYCDLHDMKEWLETI